MTEFLEFLGALFLIVIIWFLADYTGFTKATGGFHDWAFHRQLNDEVQLHQATPSPTANYVLYPTPTANVVTSPLP